MKWLRRLARWWHADRHDQALAEEIEYHRARVQADLESSGASPVDAAASSRRAMGNLALTEEDARDVWVVRWADRLSRDIRHGVRSLWHERTFAVAATLTLALGITVVTTVFSVVDAELWKPLPYPHPDHLVAAYSRGPGLTGPVDPTSGAQLLDWRQQTTTFASLAGHSNNVRRVLHLEAAQSVVVTAVTANYFETLGCAAAAGRLFTAGDAHRSDAVVLTDRAYRRLFDVDPSDFDRRPSSFRLDDDPISIVGIVRDDGLLCGGADVFLALDEDAAAFRDRAATTFFGAIGRLLPGVGREAARGELQAVITREAEAFSERDAGHQAIVEDLRDYYTGFNWRPLYFFLGAAVLVLLLSSVNVAGLLLARAVRRTREFALRGALGGGVEALARQLFVEGLLLALPAGALGVLLASWAVRLFVAALPADALARGGGIPVDLRVVLFALAVTTVTTLLFVSVPLVATRRLDLSRALGSGRTGLSAREGRVQSALLVAQLALTLVLVAGAGIFVKSFVGLTSVPLGFEASNTLSLRVSLSGPRYEAAGHADAFAGALVDTARTTPGVERAAAGSSTPLGSGPLVLFAVPEREPPPRGQELRAIIRAVTPDYFRTLGIGIRRGRAFTGADVDGAPRVAVVNERLASLAFGADDPVGRTIDLLPGARAPWTRRPGRLRIVGVAGNVKEVGLNEVEFADIYVPFAQMPSPTVELVARTGVPPASVSERLRQQAADVDPDMPVTGVSTFADRRSGVLRGDRFNALLVASFAAVAMILAGIGVYGAVAYVVQSRTREFGVRLALGATPGRLVAGSLWKAGRIGLIGGAMGLAAALALARLLGGALYLVPGSHNGLLYGVTTTDPWMLGSACVALVAMALLAGAVPARRVAKIDPTLALRLE